MGGSQKDPRDMAGIISRTAADKRIGKDTMHAHTRLFTQSELRKAKWKAQGDSTPNARSSDQHERRTAARCQCPGNRYPTRRASAPIARQKRRQRERFLHSLQTRSAASRPSWIARRATHSECSFRHSTAQRALHSLRRSEQRNSASLAVGAPLAATSDRPRRRTARTSR